MDEAAADNTILCPCACNFALRDFLCSAAADDSWCPCGLCSLWWRQNGWWCDGTSMVYLASGGKMEVGRGCREQIAADLKVPPGTIGRHGSLLHIGRCSGNGFISHIELDGISRPRKICCREEFVPVLPLEYYSSLVVELMLRGLFVGADGSAFPIQRSRPFPIVYHVREMRFGIAYALYGAFKIEFSSGYRSFSFLLDVQTSQVGRFWLTHELISTNPRSRCLRGITHLQTRFRQRRASE